MSRKDTTTMKKKLKEHQLFILKAKKEAGEINTYELSCLNALVIPVQLMVKIPGYKMNHYYYLGKFSHC